MYEQYDFCTYTQNDTTLVLQLQKCTVTEVFHHEIDDDAAAVIVATVYTIKLCRIELYKKLRGNPMKSRFCLGTVPCAPSKYIYVYIIPLQTFRGKKRREIYRETMAMYRGNGERVDDTQKRASREKNKITLIIIIFGQLFG